MNKAERKSLIDKYLNSDTSVAEERMLAQWFTAHEAEKDEETAARLILAEHPEAGYDVAGKEFDSVMRLGKRRVWRARLVWNLSACVVLALAVGFGFVVSQHNSCAFNGLEIAQGIEKIMWLDTENVESITARPKGGKVVLTAVMRDGSECSYLMRKDKDGSAIYITAINH